MGEQLGARTFTREDRQRYRDKVHRCLDVFARMLEESRFDFETPLTGMEVELNLVDADRAPRAAQHRGPRAHRRPGVRPGARPLQPRDQRAAGVALGRQERRAYEGHLRDAAERGRRARARGGRRNGDDRHPADAVPRAPDARVHQHQPALRAARPADAARTRRGPAHLDRQRPREPRDVRRLDRARGRVHQRAVPPAGEPGRVRAELERSPVPGGRAGGDRGELAVLPRARALARDAHRPLRAGDRHPSRRAEGAGGAAARLVRRALDHERVRPLRGEPHVLPTRCCPCSTTRTPLRCWTPAARRRSTSCGCTTARSGAGTGRCTTSSRVVRTCASRTACCRPGPTVVDILANGAFYFGALRALAEMERPVWSQMSFGAAEDNFFAAARSRDRQHPLLAGAGARARNRARAPPAASAGARRGSTRGTSTPASARGCSAIIEERCVTQPQRLGVADRGRARVREPRPRPLGVACAS